MVIAKSCVLIMDHWAAPSTSPQDFTAANQVESNNSKFVMPQKRTVNFYDNISPKSISDLPVFLMVCRNVKDVQEHWEALKHLLHFINTYR